MTLIGKSSRAFASSTHVAECPDAYGHTTVIVDPGVTPADVLIGRGRLHCCRPSRLRTWVRQENMTILEQAVPEPRPVPQPAPVR